MQTLNIILCCLGLLLYGLLGAMALRQGRVAERSAPLVGAAVSGVFWHLSTLLVIDAPGALSPAASRVALAAGLAALGFLPAFSLEAAVTGRAPMGRGLRTAAYGASILAGAAQLAAAAGGGAVPARLPLLLLVGAHTTLLVVLVVGRRGRDATRIARIAGLALFALSALHFAGHGAGPEPEMGVFEVLAHHAAIPLAVALLLQDFPFAFADLFLKRAARLTGLTALAAGGAMLLLPGADATVTVAIVGVSLGVALVAPRLGRAIDRGVDRLWLARPDLATAQAEFAAGVAGAEDEAGVLDAAARGVAHLTGQPSVRIERAPADVVGAPLVTVPAAGRDGGVVQIPTLEPPTWRLVIEPALDGRRLLSDEVALLEGAARTIARRLDALRHERERREAAAREEQIRRLATEAELRALRAQLNPHFLFNALTTLGWLMDEAPERAKATLYRLTSLLRAVLGRTAPGDDGGTLGDEVALLEDYLAIEQARFEERLVTEIDVPEALDTVVVPPLLLQPLVENAIKHGISPRREGGTVRVLARTHAGPAGEELHVHVIDTGAGFDPGAAAAPGAGVGLSNVRGRLAGHGGRLEIASHPGRGTDVRIVLPLQRRRPGVARSAAPIP